MSNTEKLCYTVAELHDILPLGMNSLYKLVNREDFPKIRVGKKIIIPAKGLKLWLEKQVQ
ncbi:MULTISPECIES: helix-turn-helix domain-containing protein [Paenibacillus]|uniref:Helix-turn-helix domain-containing protein n=1 Tax=Paenibacillus polymyxa (strain SC2) TaxID=886882 RepID=E3EC70_PAEPS|nr:helix-turn-helix domain-containing protein [Paenibacillus polymyxa]ADO54213.1 hypothetical protein PPSC2_01145 [Paenibacillus polymyxa SC2]TKH40219.1 DNA-binding protein [Paenibacillus polymyxa]WPQ57136.1 helix-turn-helix domain-containing protein [Paenibacillus polymyxa]